MTKYWINFQMQKSNPKVERVYSYTNKSDDEWDEYFEKSCGGVYKWWRE